MDTNFVVEKNTAITNYYSYYELLLRITISYYELL